MSCEGGEWGVQHVFVFACLRLWCIAVGGIAISSGLGHLRKLLFAVVEVGGAGGMCVSRLFRGWGVGGLPHHLTPHIAHDGWQMWEVWACDSAQAQGWEVVGVRVSHPGLWWACIVWACCHKADCLSSTVLGVFDSVLMNYRAVGCVP